MSAIKDGGPAFPHKRQIRCNGEVIDSEMEPGMTIRDFFAATALQPLVTSAIELNHSKWDAAVQHAYLIADAMLAAREAKP